mgnify:CR=1 FL=1
MGLEWALSPASTTSDADSQEGDGTLMRQVSPVKGKSQRALYLQGEEKGRGGEKERLQTNKQMFF